MNLTHSVSDSKKASMLSETPDTLSSLPCFVTFNSQFFFCFESQYKFKITHNTHHIHVIPHTHTYDMRARPKHIH
jgi:hypothetical protein